MEEKTLAERLTQLARSLRIDDIYSRDAKLCEEAAEEIKSLQQKSTEQLAKETHAINVANGWNACKPSDWDITNEASVNKIAAKIALMHSELSEALEALRKDKRENFVEEMADTYIRIIDTVYGLGFDLIAAVVKKLEKNKSRGFKHGGKAI